MHYSGDAAEQIVRMSLEGFDISVRLAGSGAKNITVLLYTILKNEQQSKGKTRLTNMLKSGKELKVFTIKEKDLKKFQQEAKKYGVLYCVLRDKDNNNPDSIVDVMSRAEDAPKINRIIERFNLATVDRALVQNDTTEQPTATPTVAPPNPTQKTLHSDDKLVDDLLGRKDKTTPPKTDSPSRPKIKSAEKRPLSDPSFVKQESSEKGIFDSDHKFSIRRELNDIKSSREKTKISTPKVEPALPPIAPKPIMHEQPKIKLRRTPKGR